MGHSETKGTRAGHVFDVAPDGDASGDASARFDASTSESSSSVTEPSYSQVLSNPRPSGRPSMRPSFRPSAFGPPRTSTRPPTAFETSELAADIRIAPLPTLPEARALLEAEVHGSEVNRTAATDQDDPSSGVPSLRGSEATEEPTPTGPRRRVRQPEQGTSLPVIASSAAPGTFRADLEELLPFVSAKHSVPQTLPALPEQNSPKPAEGKPNRLGIAIFGAMLLASSVPLVRYMNAQRSQPPGKHGTSNAQVAASPSRAEPDQAERAELREAELRDDADRPRVTTPEPAMPDKPPADPMLAAIAEAESNLPEDPVAAADQLMALGLKALSTGDERFAEALLGRALKRDDDNPRAYFALARIRMSQGNLQGAEGWIVSALHKRPRRADYHLFYATVLDAMGRPEEAAKARAQASALRSARSAAE